MLRNFLQAYSNAETTLFPGRPRHAAPILDAILNNPLVVIHGAAGSGKTSLVQTQVADELTRKGCKIYFISFIGDPLEELRAALLGIPVNGLEAQQFHRPLVQLVGDARPAGNSPLVLVFDPMEALLELKGAPVIRKFFDTLAGFLHPLSSPTQPMAHIVFVLQSKFLPDLYSKAPQTLGLESAVNYELPHLDRIDALLAMRSYFNYTGIGFTNALQSLLIKDFLRNKLRTVDLQIVFKRLYEETLTSAQPASNSQSAQIIIPTRRYRELGGINEITQNFMDHEIQEIIQCICTADKAKFNRTNPHIPISITESLRQEALYRHGIRLILCNFVTANQISAPGYRRGVVQRVIAEGRGITRRMVYRLLVMLVQRGLLTRVSDLEAVYTLSQSVLVKPIFKWIQSNPAALEQCQAQDQLRLISSDCRAFNRTYTREELEIISPHADHLAFTRRELQWALQSSVVHDVYPFYWYKRLRQEGLAFKEIVERTIAETTYQERVRVIQSLYKIGADSISWLCRLLEDTYPVVRAYAIGALEKLDLSGNWRDHLIFESYISGGNFIMGINPGNFADESLEHPVHVNSFYIGKSPVSFADYRRFLSSREEPFDFTPGLERHPIVNITWFDALEYASWANARLPSEAEWEKAASWQPPENFPNPQKRRYPWGNTFEEDHCNLSTSKINTTTPGGKYSPRGDSAYGCMDMSGNVWEWTNTVYLAYPYLANDGRESYTTTGSRVIRGGSFESGPTYVTCTVRLACNPYSRRNDLGCRCVLVIPDASKW